MFKCSLLKGITPKIRMLRFVLKTFYVFGLCFRTLAVIFVSGMLCFVPINSVLLELFICLDLDTTLSWDFL